MGILLILTSCFPRKAGPRLAHFHEQAPAVGEPAPPLSVQDFQSHSFYFSDLSGERPLVLQIGSHSCPVYRYRRPAMEELYQQYQDQVHFLIVYTLEAHPEGSPSPYANEEWLTWYNIVTNVRVAQPKTLEARIRQAMTSTETLELQTPVVVDEMTNSTWQAYGAAPSPAFVIDSQGQVVLRQVWLQPDEIRHTLDRLLAEVP